MQFLKRFILPVLVLLALITVLSVKILYAQTGEPEPPSIDQIVSALMTGFGTWAVAYVVNIARTKLGIIPGSWFVGLIVPLLGMGISALTKILGVPGHSWLISFFATFGSVWLSQLQAQLNGYSGPLQYLKFKGGN